LEMHSMSSDRSKKRSSSSCAPQSWAFIRRKADDTGVPMAAQALRQAREAAPNRSFGEWAGVGGMDSPRARIFLQGFLTGMGATWLGARNGLGKFYFPCGKNPKLFSRQANHYETVINGSRACSL